MFLITPFLTFLFTFLVLLHPTSLSPSISSFRLSTLQESTVQLPCIKVSKGLSLPGSSLMWKWKEGMWWRRGDWLVAGLSRRYLPCWSPARSSFELILSICPEPVPTKGTGDSYVNSSTNGFNCTKTFNWQEDWLFWPARCRSLRKKCVRNYIIIEIMVLRLRARSGVF